ncbi:hypothetical protein BDA96_10G337300 [Sorghum bicolor]|uniref:Uncharacterized protein n=2 Tax=Sorghum bicolor TaxID=4558 RepID=C5Z1S1_SORBI|nr:protein SHI RELATED SEQUENCE 1 [Sorghum bicolor]XP_021304847.1 protein SHI RELATED SEQUENCE 1 [Sorghum bicolor]EER88951.1 hypothetical protein SORBI_3010G261700 [Sorghum bicolor]KAG0516141.1 hypothetical protein BDA96_10G337300 [Sorghum bicolor]|eukprot:XP_002437584.1 protein SHI RELATED SEQUENCE 1 [Sorghum bicolor]
MAGFSLRGGGGGGGGRGGDRGGDHPIGADSLFLYARGAAAAAADTAASGGGGGGGIGFQLWHPHQQAAAAAAAPHTSQFFSSGAVATGVVLGFSSHDGGAGGIGGPGGAGGGRAGTSCQDCGNNAKKDCAHMRCRTCCRSRGFSCPTHVKSTWVPAAKRRERQQQLAALFRGAANSNSASAAAAAAAAAAASKRPRELVRSLGRLPSANSAMVTTTTSSGDGGGGRFPPELNVEAVFRCVRIGPVDEPDAELAYQTAVSIGGHTFKGILRDHGPADDAAVGQLPPSSAEYHQLTAGQAREGSSPAGSSEAAATVATSAAVLMDPYPTPIGAFAAGTQFFPHNPRT